MKSSDEERVKSRFAAYDTTGKRYVVEEFVTVYDSRNVRGWQGTGWPDIPQYRLFDGTPVEREGEDRYSFRDKSGRQVELSTDKPAQ